MGFKTVELNALPDEVNAQLVKQIKIKGIHHCAHQGIRYYLLSMGPQPNPGYRIKIEQIQHEQNETVVKFSMEKPQPGAMVIQVISYPHLIGIGDGPIVFVDTKTKKQWKI